MIRTLLTLLLWCCFLFGGYVAYTALNLPNVREALQQGVEPDQTSQILASDNSLIMAYGKFHYKPLTITQISPPLIDALIATEDRRFYHHHGIDLFGVARAVASNIKNHKIEEGGSTLTQQLARNIFLTNERSVQRKIKEALLAIKLEQQLTKAEILQLYLNNVYFGEGAYGVGAASDIYFGKSPKALSLDEAALLAGLPQAPSHYSPFVNYDLAKKRRNEVLQNLVEVGKLDQDKADALKKREIHLNPNGRALAASNKAPYFNQYVIQQTLDTLGMDEQTFWQKGLKIYTTIDPRAQRLAQDTVHSVSAATGRNGRKQQAALISIDNKGRIIAYVGGKDFGQSQFDRVNLARRQAGSLFKVFVYTTAMQAGMSPQTVYKDEPIEFDNYDHWKPENYDHKYHGFMSLAEALIHSDNIIAVKLIRDVGPDAVIKTARKMGLQSPLNSNLSLALGSADVTLKEMTAAFSVLADEGIFIKPYGIEKIVDRHGQILYEHQDSETRALPREVRDKMVQIMEGVLRFGTGKGANIGRPAAGKTGTSDDYRNAWFIGFTPEVTTGVWVGNDDNSVMPGITGGSIPARIWHQYMSNLVARMPVHDFAFASDSPLEEKDFFVYSLDNLAESEGQASDADREQEAHQSADVPVPDQNAPLPPTEGQMPQPYAGDPNGGQVPNDGSQPMYPPNPGPQQGYQNGPYGPPQGYPNQPYYPPQQQPYGGYNNRPPQGPYPFPQRQNYNNGPPPGYYPYPPPQQGYQNAPQQAQPRPMVAPNPVGQ